MERRGGWGDAAWMDNLGNLFTFVSCRTQVKLCYLKDTWPYLNVPSLKSGLDLVL